MGGDRVGPLLRHRFVRRLALEVMTEAVQVARLEGVTLLKIAPPGRGERAQDALALVMQALDADVVRASVPVRASDVDEHGEINEPGIVDALRHVVVELAGRAHVERAA